MRSITIRLAILWTTVLSLAAFARVHFRSVTTGVAYDLGKLKTQESKLLEERSALKGDLARITTKKRLEDLAQGSENAEAKGASKQ